MQNLILDAKHDMIQRGELTPSIFPGETDDLDQDQIFLHNWLLPGQKPISWFPKAKPSKPEIENEMKQNDTTQNVKKNWKY